MKKIRVGPERFTIVDDSDFELVARYSWQSYLHHGNFVVHRPRRDFDPQGLGLPRKIYLHRFLMNAQKGQIVDHIDGDSLNNQRSNLRFCDYSGNSSNTSSRLGSSSRFLGVSRSRTPNRWVAQYEFNYKNYHIGVYDSEKEAALIYNVAASFAFREFARLNVI